MYNPARGAGTISQHWCARDRGVCTGAGGAGGDGQIIKGLGTKIQSLKTMDTLRKSYKEGGRERCASALRAKLSVVVSSLTEVGAKSGAAAEFAAACLSQTGDTLRRSGRAEGGEDHQRRIMTWLQNARSRAKVLRGQVQRWRDKYHATQVALAARHESLARISKRLAAGSGGSRLEASLNASLMEDEDDLRVRRCHGRALTSCGA